MTNLGLYDGDSRIVHDCPECVVVDTPTGAATVVPFEGGWRTQNGYGSQPGRPYPSLPALLADEIGPPEV